MKILQIDDTEDIRKFVEVIITSMGHEFDSVDGGRKGVEMISKNKYDLVILDLSMPDFSGIDVIQELISKNLLKKQIIVIFSASANAGNSIEGIPDEAIHSFLPKPIDVDKLMEKITEIEKQIS